MLSNKEWIKINEMIIIIYSIKDINLMREYFLDALMLLVPYDKAMFYFLDNDNIKLPILKNINQDFFSAYINAVNNSDNGKIALNLHRSIAYRDSDFSDNMKETNEVYLKLLIPHKMNYGGGIVIAQDHAIIAELTIYRNRLKGDFNDNELEILNILKDHLKIRLTQNYFLLDNLANSLLKYNLTSREIDIIKAIVEEKSNEEIAKALFISIHTVKKHITNIYAKLKIKNRLQLLKIIENE